MTGINQDLRESLQGLEKHLKWAPVIGMSEFPDPGGYHKAKAKVYLTGGIAALAKPGGGAVDGEFLIRCEATAWEVAKILGFTDFVPATVLRTLPSLKLGVDSTECSLQVIVGEIEPDVWYDDFDQTAMIKAAVFDYVMGQTDRKNHNWLATKGGTDRHRFYLADNGFSCLHPPTKGFASRFFDAVKGEALPDDVVAALGRLVEDGPSLLGDLAPPGKLPGIIERAEHLIREQRLVVAPEVAALGS